MRLNKLDKDAELPIFLAYTYLDMETVNEFSKFRTSENNHTYALAFWIISCCLAPCCLACYFLRVLHF